MFNKLGDLSIKTSEGLYTRTMQYQAQMAKPALNRPQTCQNNGLNMLIQKLKRLGEHAHMLAHKQGATHNTQPSKTMKKWNM